MNRKKKKITVVLIIIFILLIALSAGYFVFAEQISSLFTKKTTSTSTSTPTSTPTYDENNIGELYYSPIDADHVAESDDGIMYADNEILLVAKEGTAKEEIEKLAKEYDAEIVGYIEQTGDYQLKLSEAKTEDEINDLISKIEGNEYVDSVTFNYISETDEDSVTDDVQFGSRWSKDLSNSNDNKGLSWGVEAINATDAWDYLNEHKSDINPIKVGLVDSGFDTSHDDLGFAEVFYDEEANNVTVSESNKKHGTHVAGIMAARGDNDGGICGVYPYGDGRLYGVSSTGEFEYSENKSYSTSSMYQKIAFSELILRNVKVINSSQNNRRDRVDQIVNKKDGWEDALKELNVNSDILGSFLNRLLKLNYDFVIVSAAGNGSNSDTGHMEAQYNGFINAIDKDKYEDVYNRIIVVGAINNDFSVRTTSNAGNRVDIFAPGGDIYSTLPSIDSDGNKLNEDEQYGKLSGTSMATPHVAGVCADVWSVNNNLTGKQVKEIVCNSSIDNTTPYTSSEGIEKYVVDCNKAVRTAAASKGLKTKENKNKGAILTQVVESYEDDGLLDTSNIGLGDVTVDAYRAGTKKLAYTTVSDKDGHVELFVADGTYDITASLDGYGSATIENIVVKSQEVTYCSWLELIKTTSIQGKDPEKATSQEEEISDAEKYAQIVMDNEDLWLDTINQIDSFDGTNSCWFEDLDFDGKLEFIVGGANWNDTDGWIPSSNRYYVYRFEKNKMKLIKNQNYTDINVDFITLCAKNTYSNTSADNGFADIAMEVLYDSDDDSYSRLYLTGASGGDYYGLYSVKFDSSKSEDFISGFDATTGRIDSDNYDSIISDVNSYSSNKTHCDTSVYTISCTKTSSNAYDNMSNDDKKAELIESYNSFKISKTDNKSSVIDNFISKADELKGYDIDAIKNAYKDIVDQKLKETYEIDPDMYNIEYTMFDIDKDNIPELIINAGTSYADHSISVYSFDTDLNVSYLIKDNISGFHVSFYKDIDNDQLVAAGGVTGAGFITRFSMDNGTLNVDEGTFDMYTYDLYDIGNFMSIGLYYRPSTNYYYRDGYSDVELYDIIDNYIY